MREEILRLLAEACGNPALAAQPETELLDSGILDSLAFITFLEAVDSRLGLEVQPTQIPLQSWRTPALLADALAALAGN